MAFKPEFVQPPFWAVFSFFDIQDMTGNVRREPSYLRTGFLNSSHFEGLILAQDERWRRALGMQVERT